jgi:hypothetical protein
LLEGGERRPNAAIVRGWTQEEAQRRRHRSGLSRQSTSIRAAWS